MCTGSCTSIWVPLTLSGSGKPSGSSDVSSKLGTVDRPDGAVQVTYQGSRSTRSPRTPVPEL
jgi:predicted lipoprotein with Yx(FWY)xxD motif